MTSRRVVLPEGTVDRAQVQEVVEAIRAGRLVVLPTETVYGIAAIAGDQESIDRVRALKNRSPDRAFTHHVASIEAAHRLASSVPQPVERLLDRYWPGPLTVVLPGREEASVGLRLQAHPFTQAVIEELGDSVYLPSISDPETGPLSSPDEIEKLFGDRIDLLVDGGPAPLQQASTVVRWLAEGELEVLREGALRPVDVWQTASRPIVFVCSGNTCRSPIAEVVARRTAARALNTTDDHVLAHGLWFTSAGTSAFPGAEASDGSRDAVAEIGLDLSAHLSQPLTREMCERAEKIYCLGPSHLVAVQSLGAGFAAKAELLDPEGAGIPDPFGGDLDLYRKTRDAVVRAVEVRMRELLAPVG